MMDSPGLPAALETLLDLELSAGNTVAWVDQGGAVPGRTTIHLTKPFFTPSSSVHEGLSYKEREARGAQVILEYITADGTYAVSSRKPKPIVFASVTGPENPTEKHVEFMKKFEQEELARAKRAMQVSNDPLPTRAHPEEPAAPQAPVERFVSSMQMDLEKWREGTGCDLEALDEMSEEERTLMESRLLAVEPKTWREFEALRHLGTPKALAAIQKGLKSESAEERAAAVRYVEGDDPGRVKALVESLEETVFYGGLTQTLLEVEEFHPQPILDALFRGAMHRSGEIAVHFAAMLYFLYGKAEEVFDWNHRPFFLRFHTEDGKEREAVFLELCEQVGVDPKPYLKKPGKKRRRAGR